MKRREMLATAGASVIGVVAGCLGFGGEREFEDLDRAITSVDEVMPGQWERVETRSTDVQPAGYDDSEVAVFESDDDYIEISVVLFDSTDDASEAIQEFMDAHDDDQFFDDEYQEEEMDDVADEAYYRTGLEPVVLGREANIFVQVQGSVNSRHVFAVAYHQLDEF